MGFLLNGLILCLLLLVGGCASLGLGAPDGGARHGEGRSLVSFKEMRGNVSFRCSPSGPCLPCEYSEKTNVIYRCSETGYRVPLKCVEIKDEAKSKSEEKSRRSLVDKPASFTSYRSCLPAEAEERLSLLGFETIMVGLLLVSGFFVYVRQKRSIPLLGLGAGRFPLGSSRL